MGIGVEVEVELELEVELEVEVPPTPYLTPCLAPPKVSADGTSEWISGLNADLNAPKSKKEKKVSARVRARARVGVRLRAGVRVKAPISPLHLPYIHISPISRRRPRTGRPRRSPRRPRELGVS